MDSYYHYSRCYGRGVHAKHYTEAVRVSVQLICQQFICDTKASKKSSFLLSTGHRVGYMKPLITYSQHWGTCTTQRRSYRIQTRSFIAQSLASDRSQHASQLIKTGSTAINLRTIHPEKTLINSPRVDCSSVLFCRSALRAYISVISAHRFVPDLLPVAPLVFSDTRSPVIWLFDPLRSVFCSALTLCGLIRDWRRLSL